MFITRIEIDNFMSIGHAEIEFDDTNIINLCGYNDSGKSAVIRLLDIMLFYSYVREQVKFIKDGESYFRGILYFSDGVEYEFKKLATGQSLFTLSKDGDILYSNTSGSSIISVSEVPKPIADYLGVLKDEVTGEKLNIRRCTDRLFLINTSGGDNYKILNVVLQSDVLADASMNLNTDKNKLMGEITAGYNKISALKNECNSLQTVPEENLDSIENILNIFQDKKSVFNEICSIADCERFISETVVPDELQEVSLGEYNELEILSGVLRKTESFIPSELHEVSTSRFEELGRMLRISEKADCFIPTELQEIDNSQLTLLQNLCNLEKRLSLLESSINQEVVPIDTARYSEIERMSRGVVVTSRISNDLSTCEEQLESSKKRLHILCKENGIACCPECGAVFKEVI